MKLDTATITRLRDELLETGRRPTLVLSPAYEDLTREGLLSTEETEALSRVDPIAEAMFLMMAADGTLADEEINVIRGAIRGLTNSVLRSGTIKVMLETYTDKLNDEGWEARLKEVSERLGPASTDAETAYGLVAAVAVADKEVTLEENDLIDRFGELLGIDDQRCCELLNMIKEDQAPPWDANG